MYRTHFTHGNKFMWLSVMLFFPLLFFQCCAHHSKCPLLACSSTWNLWHPSLMLTLRYRFLVSFHSRFPHYFSLHFLSFPLTFVLSSLSFLLYRSHFNLCFLSWHSIWHNPLTYKIIACFLFTHPLCFGSFDLTPYLAILPPCRPLSWKQYVKRMSFGVLVPRSM